MSAHATNIKIGMTIRPTFGKTSEKEEERLEQFRLQVNTMVVEWVGQATGSNLVQLAGRHAYDTLKLSPQHGYRVGDPMFLSSYRSGDDFEILVDPYEVPA